MNPTQEQNLICGHCESDMRKNHLNHEHLDINTTSLVMMFRVHQLVEAECPGCGHKHLHI